VSPPAERLEVVFPCGCTVVLGELLVMLEPCEPDCLNLQLIRGELDRCLSQLRVRALGGGILPYAGAGAGGSL
jgi:hypothetical protein